jgi:hypothetical protein
VVYCAAVVLTHQQIEEAVAERYIELSQELNEKINDLIAADQLPGPQVIVLSDSPPHPTSCAAQP